MKRKTKRKCNNKRRCTRRKMRGGNGISLEDYRINLFKTQELLQDPTIQKKLEEEEKKEDARIKESKESQKMIAMATLAMSKMIAIMDKKGLLDA